MIYDEQRMSYHCHLVTVETSTMVNVIKLGRQLTLLTQREAGARRGLIISRPWASGKTTDIQQLGKAHELRIRLRYPDQTRTPVVFITTPPKESPRKLARKIAYFLEASAWSSPTPARSNG